MNIAPVRSMLKPWPRTYRVARNLYGRCYPLIERYNDAQIRRVLRAQVRGLDKVWFVQVGANDGIRADLLHEMICADDRWQGLLLEPVPYLFRRLCENVQHLSHRLTCRQLAASDEQSQATFYHLPESLTHIDGKPVPQWFNGIGSFHRDHILRHLGPAAEQHIVEHPLQADTLKHICDEASVPRVDVLAMDTEGHEWRVLRGFDFDRYRPHAILFEHRHLHGATRDQMFALLEQQGFVSRIYGANSIAIRKGS